MQCRLLHPLCLLIHHNNLQLPGHLNPLADQHQMEDSPSVLNSSANIIHIHRVTPPKNAVTIILHCDQAAHLPQQQLFEGKPILLFAATIVQ